MTESPNPTPRLAFNAVQWPVILEILTGVKPPGALSYAFGWASHSNGASFWAEQAAQDKLSRAARAELSRMIDQLRVGPGIDRRLQLTALELSIDHWNRMATGKQFDNEKPSAWSCALCALYMRGGFCHGCPIFLETGRHLCENAPYDTAFELYINPKDVDAKAFQEAAAEMADWLQELYNKLADLEEDPRT